ncbi:histidinol dehydrogenase [Salinibacter sp. 10B]|uniref:histidinol dehydrogenase n=1 Tax=Salinibacter sp. 10B TaxID=1923971 RepID=UPI000CF49DCA|nr:histidinol dehydrogenase [Salinibacter sp. 10B]PQJ36570.1 histidinol dehydrogenase [Salinibacter sp. 10B]
MIPLISPDDTDRLNAILSRDATFSDEVDAAVDDILAQVRQSGDTALLDLTKRFDGVRPDPVKIPPSLLDEASDALEGDLREAIGEAASNIRQFHEKQVPESWFTDDGDGVILGQRVVPMERAGLYVPGGTAFYPSSLLMNAIPAQVAGVEEIHLVSPPQDDGRPHPLVMATAAFLGLDNVYAVGGAQAVGALAFGTDTVPAVDKIVGPGNAYVAAAKKKVFGRVGIDSVAGPSEIGVLADETADPAFVAADLLSQAEHDVRASAILITPHRPLAEAVQAEVEARVPELPRADVIEQALADYGACIVTETMEEAVDLMNELAVEHLEIHVDDPWQAMTRIRHAGAIFLGEYSSEPVGDYFAGPNHVLPTGGTARHASALGVDDFIRTQSILSYSRDRLEETGEQIVTLAEAEELQAHAEAIRTRLNREE